MPFIGAQPATTFAKATSQVFTNANGNIVDFTLNKHVSNPEDIEVFVSNVQQQPTTSYTILSDGVTLRFSEAPPSGDFYVVYRNLAQQTGIDTGALRKTGGALSGTISNFTSTGIDDNANANAVTIDSSQNVKIGSANDFAGTDDTLQLGNGAFKIFHNGGGGNSVACMLSTANSMQIFTDIVRFTSADNTEGLFGADKNGAFFAKYDNNTVLQTTTLGALVSRHDTSCTFEMKANTSSGSGTPQFMMFRSGTRHGFMEAGVNSSANGGGNHFVLRAEQGDVFAIDSSNNSTQLSPHNFDYIPDGASETGAWCYKSDKFEREVIEKDEEGNKIKEKIKSGTFISADMTKVIRQVEKLTGEKLIYKGTLDVNEDGEVSKHIDDGSTVKDNIIADLIKRIEALEKA